MRLQEASHGQVMIKTEDDTRHYIERFNNRLDPALERLGEQVRNLTEQQARLKVTGWLRR
jgi:hypothetical protein